MQREFDDYTADSQQLEKEYEATIEQHEKTIRELRVANNKLQNELESARVRIKHVYNKNTCLNDLCFSVEIGSI